MLWFGRPSRPVAVAVEEPDLAGAVESLFRPHVLSGTAVGDAASTPPVARVGRRTSGYGLTRPGRGEERFDTLPDLLGALEATILRGLLGSESAATHLHAAGAVTEDGALLALGGSGAGKSNLAMAWARAGLPLLGDDAVLMDGDGSVRALPRLVKVERSRLPELGIEAESTVAHDPAHPEVWIDPSERTRWADAPAPPAVVAGVRFDGGPDTRVRRLDAPDGLRLLLGSVLPSGVAPEDSVDRFIAALEGAALVEVRFGRSEDAARRMMEVARG